MSEQHLDKGVGILKQYSIAVLTRVAEVIAKNPSFKHLVGSVDPTHGIGTAQVLRVLSGYFDFPGDGTAVALLNDVFDDFIGTLATLIEEHAHDPVALDSAIKPVLEKAVAKARTQEVIIALEQVHRSKECLTVATYVADATAPSFVGKDGKERSNPTRARLLTTSFTEAMKAKKALCPLCFPAAATASAAAIEPGKAETKDEAPKAAPKMLHDHLAEYRKAKPFAPEPDIFWRNFLKADDIVKRKLTTAFAQRGSIELIDYFADLPAEQWDPALNAMLGNQNTAVESFTRFVMRKLGDAGKKVGDRFHDEAEEEKRVIKRVGKVLKAANGTLALKLSPPVLMPHEPSTTNRMKFIALTSTFVLVVALIVYAAHMLG